MCAIKCRRLSGGVRRCQEAARSRVLSPISRHKNIILEPDSAAGHILVIGAGAGRHRSASRIKFQFRSGDLIVGRQDGCGANRLICNQFMMAGTPGVEGPGRGEWGHYQSCDW